MMVTGLCVERRRPACRTMLRRLEFDARDDLSALARLAPPPEAPGCAWW